MKNRDRHLSQSFVGAQSLIASSSMPVSTPDSLRSLALCGIGRGEMGMVEANPWLSPETETQCPGESDYSELLFGGTPWCGYGDDLDDDEAYFLDDDDDDDDDDFDEDYDDEDDDDFDDEDFDRESEEEDDDEDL
ncbi:MAG: hypothetical protein ACWA5W_03010 [Phycisphaerales bacterium]